MCFLLVLLNTSRRELIYWALIQHGRPPFGMCLKLHEKLFEVELILLLGNFDACGFHVKHILKHRSSEEIRLKAMWYQILVKVAENKLVESILTA
jgi:hypothetical protein